MVIFDSYASLPEGMLVYQRVLHTTECDEILPKCQLLLASGENIFGVHMMDVKNPRKGLGFASQV